MDQETIIAFKDASICGGDRTVISNLNMEIHKGDFVYITGKVGSGKTSIIRTLIAQTPLESGQCTILGYNLENIRKREIPALRRSLGVVFQDFRLLEDRNVHDNLRFILEATLWKEESRMETRIENVLKAVGMETKAHRMPYQLSGGEQQRIAIARSLLNGKQLILADEPTGNLDEQTSAEIMDLFRALNAKGTTIVMVTHNLSLLEKYPGRVFTCISGTCTESTGNDNQ